MLGRQRGVLLEEPNWPDPAADLPAICGKQRRVLEQRDRREHAIAPRGVEAFFGRLQAQDVAVCEHGDAQRSLDGRDRLPVGAHARGVLGVPGAAVHRHQRGPGGLEHAGKGDRALRVVEDPHLGRHRDRQVRRERRDHLGDEARLLHQEGAVPPPAGDALRAAQVEVDGVDPAALLEDPRGSQHRRRVVAAELGQQRPVGVRGRKLLGAVRWRLGEEPGVHHGRVGAGGAVPAAEQAEGELGLLFFVG